MGREFSGKSGKSVFDKNGEGDKTEPYSSLLNGRQAKKIVEYFHTLPRPLSSGILIKYTELG